MTLTEKFQLQYFFSVNTVHILMCVYVPDLCLANSTLFLAKKQMLDYPYFL